MKAFKVLALAFTFVAASLIAPARAEAATALMENLNRGVVAVRTSSTSAFVSWRMLGTDSAGVEFNLYRSTGGGTAVLLTGTPPTSATCFADTTADFTLANAYYVRPVISGIEQAPSETYTLAANASVQQYLRVPLQIPAGLTMPDSTTCTYSANDCSVGDLDGDGEYEIIVKWDPSNSKDNSQSGYTGNVYLDAYKLNGTQLWRIDLGVNIRAGAHYTQFMVYDLDGDGKAEVACRTAEGSKGADNNYVAAPAKFSGTPPSTLDHTADRRNTGGYILGGAEFLTIFNGQTGTELTSTNYNPQRYPGNLFPTTAQINALWGDDYGNRIDRFLACVAYLDGQRPSLVMCRGYYTRTALVAYDYRNGTLTQRWIFDTNPDGATATTWANYRGQGHHNLSVADVDGDGRDEIVYGSCTIDDDGRGLYSTLLGHGDAIHVSDLDPNRPGLEVWVCHEDVAGNGNRGHTFRDAATGTVIFSKPSTDDTGRCMTADIDPAYPGFEMWGARSNVVTVSGTDISTTKPSQNFGIWWDGDLSRELLDNVTISKWNPATTSASAVLSPSGVASNNSTKATPNLSADIFGDWREEVVWRETDSSALRIYTTTAPTATRLYTLMHNRQYRESIAWQNVAYNQPPYPNYFLGNGMSTPPQPDIVTSIASLPATAPAAVAINRYDPATSSTGATSMIFRVSFNTAVTGVDIPDFTFTTTGTVTGTITSVTAQSTTTYDVLVSSITGVGTARLDLNATGTGIASSVGGVAISGGFTGGETYTRVVLAWLSTAPSGGVWSTATNWDGGVIPDGVGAAPIFGNYDVPANTTVALDTPRTLSGLTFGDTNTATPASWAINNNSTDTNILTLDVTSGAPTLTVNTLGAGATATVDAVLAGTDGLTKAGTGTLVLTKPNSLSGPLTVSAGTLRLGAGGALTSGTVSLPSGSTLNVAGGSLTTTGLVTAAAGTLSIDSGTVAFNAGYRTNSTSATTLRLNGGALTANDINMRRTSAATIDFTTGFIAAGGTANIGTLSLGTDNSNAAMSVEGGAVTVTGPIVVGFQSSVGRGGGLRVLSGSLTSTDTAYGIALTRTSGNVTVANFSGGITTAEKITLGYSSSVIAGSATLTLSGGELYLGSGGLVMNGVAPFAATINLSGGTLGAKAAWSTSLPAVLANTTTIKTANAANAAFDITLGGALSGTGGLAKAGTGLLTLSAINTFTGAVDINAGTLAVTGATSTASSVNVNAGGTLAGTGNAGTVVLGGGGTVAPGLAEIGTLSGTSLVFNGGGRLALDLGASGTSDSLALSGALTKGTSGACELAFSPGSRFFTGSSYTIATYGSTNFSASDFTVTGMTGYTPTFNVGATSLQVTFTITPPTITSATSIGGTMGQTFNFGITGTNTPTSYSASGLPSGLTLNTSTGVITGTPTVPGTYTIQLSATNGGGTSSVTATLTVTENAALVTLFGSAGASGNTNGTGTAARFNNPNALAVDASGFIYVADTANHLVRKIGLNNAVTTLAGSGSAGSADGTGVAASFSSPAALVPDNAGNLYLADTGNNSIRKIVVSTGVVTTLATGFNAPAGLALDNGNLYVANSAGHTISKIVLSGPIVTTLAGSGMIGSTDATGTAASFNSPRGLATDTNGNLYVADTGNNMIRKVVLSTGVVTTTGGATILGGTDGNLTLARFNAPRALALDAAGRIYLADTANHTLRKIVLSNGAVTTLVGLPGVAGTSDGLGAAARLNSPSGIGIDVTGDIYVADSANHTVRILQVAPEIVTHPQSQTVTAGSNVQFSTVVTGSPTPTLEWKKDGVVVPNPVSSSDTRFSVSNVTAANAGNYTVTATNAMGSITSNVATLTVTTPPSSSSSSSGGGGGGGGGAFAPWTFLFGAILILLRARRR
ncbi:MAG: immunoglobulin domain-containing protein [Nibricoccus sp.]